MNTLAAGIAPTNVTQFIIHAASRHHAVTKCLSRSAQAPRRLLRGIPQQKNRLCLDHCSHVFSGHCKALLYAGIPQGCIRGTPLPHCDSRMRSAIASMRSKTALRYQISCRPLNRPLSPKIRCSGRNVFTVVTGIYPPLIFFGGPIFVIVEEALIATLIITRHDDAHDWTAGICSSVDACRMQ